METCPRCRTPFHSATIAELPAAQCAGCGGVWVGVPIFRHLCSDTDAQTALLSIEPPAVALSEKRVEYLKCPDCENLMNRVRFAYGCNVVTHVCAGHGIWTNVPALQQIVLFIQGGGLARAQRKAKEETDRKREMAHLSSILDASTGRPGSFVI